MVKPLGKDFEKKKRRALELLNQNRLDEAKALYEKLSRRLPKDAAVWFMLGTVEGRLGRLGAAEQAMRQALHVDPALAEAWLGLGQALELQGRVDDASETYLKALERKPQLAEAHAALGRLYNAKGWYGRALEHLNRAIGLGLGRPQVELERANALKGCGKYRPALELYQALLAHFPKDPGLRAKIAAMHFELGEIETAYQRFADVLELKPDDVGARLGRAHISYLKKDTERALQQVRTLFDSHPDNFAVPALYSQMCHLDDSCDEVIARQEALLPRRGIPNNLKTMYYFDLGRLYDAKGDYERAFGYFEQGNRRMRGQYDRDDADRTIAGIMADHRPAVLARTASLAVERPRPLFIIGMPRSGTSLVEQIVASHPQVCGAGELTDLVDIANEYRGGRNAAEPWVSELTEEALNAMAARYLERLDAIATGNPRYVSDKLPSNMFRIGLIHKLFPDARILHVRRNPIDTCLSCYFHNFSGYHTYCYDLGDLVHYYRNYRRLMAYWRETLPRPMLELDYEALVADAETQVRRVLDFLELDWDDRCMRFYQNKRAVITSSHAQVQNPIYNQSVARWRHYAGHIQPLIEGFADEAQ